MKKAQAVLYGYGLIAGGDNIEIKRRYVSPIFVPKKRSWKAYQRKMKRVRNRKK